MLSRESGEDTYCVEIKIKNKMDTSMMRLMQWIIGHMKMEGKYALLRQQNNIDGHQTQK